MESEAKRVAVRCVFAIGVVCWANFFCGQKLPKPKIPAFHRENFRCLIKGEVQVTSTRSFQDPRLWKSLVGSWAHRFQGKLFYVSLLVSPLDWTYVCSFEFGPIIKLQQILPCFVFNFYSILSFCFLARSHIALNIKQRMEECAHNDSKEATPVASQGEFCFADWVRGGGEPKIKSSPKNM